MFSLIISYSPAKTAAGTDIFLKLPVPVCGSLSIISILQPRFERYSLSIPNTTPSFMPNGFKFAPPIISFDKIFPFTTAINTRFYQQTPPYQRMYIFNCQAKRSPLQANLYTQTLNIRNSDKIYVSCENKKYRV